MPASDPHDNQPVLSAGAALESARAAMILLHGRGGSAEDILSLSGEFAVAGNGQRLAFLAPQAAGSTWYPYSFLAPREENEPWLSSALAKVESLVSSVAKAGIPRECILVCGFSQGACLTTEFVASHPARYAGLIAFTGGLIGPPGSELTHAGNLDGTPALFLSGDPDPHVPWQRVEESARIYKQMGAAVEAQRFPGRPHTISSAELGIAQRFVERILENVAAPHSPAASR